MHADGGDQLVAEGHGVPDHVQMAVGDGIEGTWIEGNARHGPLLPRPRRPGKRGRVPSPVPVGAEIGPRAAQGPVLSANEPVGSRLRLPEGRLVSSRPIGRNKLAPDETNFGLWRRPPETTHG